MWQIGGLLPSVTGRPHGDPSLQTHEQRTDFMAASGPTTSAAMRVAAPRRRCRGPRPRVEGLRLSALSRAPQARGTARVGCRTSAASALERTTSVPRLLVEAFTDHEQADVSPRRPREVLMQRVDGESDAA